MKGTFFKANQVQPDVCFTLTADWLAHYKKYKKTNDWASTINEKGNSRTSDFYSSLIVKQREINTRDRLDQVIEINKNIKLLTSDINIKIQEQISLEKWFKLNPEESAMGYQEKKNEYLNLDFDLKQLSDQRDILSDQIVDAPFLAPSIAANQEIHLFEKNLKIQFTHVFENNVSNFNDVSKILNEINKSKNGNPCYIMLTVITKNNLSHAIGLIFHTGTFSDSYFYYDSNDLEVIEFYDKSYLLDYIKSIPQVYSYISKN